MKSVNKLLIDEIHELVRTKDHILKSSTLETIKYKGVDYPIVSFSIGNPDPQTPVLSLFAGVHGLEKIGTELNLSFLRYILRRVKWDLHFREVFKHLRIESIPLINPVGLIHNTRSNGNGVDLMRNSPTVAIDKPYPLVGGHRISNKIPWYQGQVNDEMELENLTVSNFVKQNVQISPYSISLDIHSGFGFRDRIWYPYAKSTAPFADEQTVLNLKTIFEQTYINHIYKIEKQSSSYTTNGDLWDFLYDSRSSVQNIFIPLTLEMGSWSWIKKNPIQIFKPQGLFNPVKTHRFSRVMRRHLNLLDFLIYSTAGYKSWI